MPGMPGLALPDCGGSWIADTGGGEGGSLPPGVVEQLTIFGRNGVVISGVVTWIQAQLGTHGPEIWKSMAERCFSEDEVTAAKEALREDFKKNPDYLMTLIKRVGGYLAEITTS